MSRRYRVAQINFARLPVPLSDPQLEGFVTLLQGANTLAEASPGFVWRLDEHSAAASADRVFPNQAPGTTLVNLSIWKSVSALQRYAIMGKDGGVVNARQSFFQRFEGRWVALWWVPEGHFPEVADGWARIQHLRRHREQPYAFSLWRPFPPPVGEQDYLCVPETRQAVANGLRGTPAVPPLTAQRADVPRELDW